MYGEDPAAQATAFATAGFRWLHVVDLDGAFAGSPANAEAVRAVLAPVSLPVQLGGGVRDMATLEAGWRPECGASFWAPRRPRTPISRARHAGRIPGASPSALTPETAVSRPRVGRKSVSMTALDLALRFEDAGAAAIIHTDIERDGMLGGVNVAATGALADRLTTPVIACGGVAGASDLRAIRAAGNIAGVIVGRALYEGGLTAAEALAEA